MKIFCQLFRAKDDNERCYIPPLGKICSGLERTFVVFPIMSYVIMYFICYRFRIYYERLLEKWFPHIVLFPGKPIPPYNFQDLGVGKLLISWKNIQA